MNYYSILGIEEDADAEAIRSAYRKLVRRYHPDLSGKVDATRFRQIHEAYQTLSDPKARVKYDRHLGTEIPVRIVSRKHPIDDIQQRVNQPSSDIVREIHPRSGVVQGDPHEDFYRAMRRFFDDLWRSFP